MQRPPRAPASSCGERAALQLRYSSAARAHPRAWPAQSTGGIGSNTCDSYGVIHIRHRVAQMAVKPWRLQRPHGHGTASAARTSGGSCGLRQPQQRPRKWAAPRARPAVTTRVRSRSRRAHPALLGGGLGLHQEVRRVRHHGAEVPPEALPVQHNAGRRATAAAHRRSGLPLLPPRIAFGGGPALGLCSPGSGLGGDLGQSPATLGSGGRGRHGKSTVRRPPPHQSSHGGVRVVKHQQKMHVAAAIRAEALEVLPNLPLHLERSPLHHLLGGGGVRPARLAE